MESAVKLSITMSPEMLSEIRASVEAGEYVSTSEAVRDAVRFWQQKRREDAEHLVAIRTRVRKALEDPRPDLTSAEVRAHLEILFAKAEKDFGNAAS